MRANPKKLNALQLKTLAILQAMANERRFADPPDGEGAIAIHTLPHAHGDHLHIGSAVIAARDATGLANPNVLSALARKGLLRGSAAGLPVLTPEGLAYETGLAGRIFGRTSH